MFLYLKIKTEKKISKNLLINFLKLGTKCDYINKNIFFLNSKILKILKIFEKIENFNKRQIDENCLENIKEILKNIDEIQISQYFPILEEMKNLKKIIKMLKKKKKILIFIKKILKIFI